MNTWDESRQCPDVATLGPTLRGIGGRFWYIARLNILTAIHDSTKQAICLALLGKIAGTSRQWAAFKDRS